MSVTTATQLEPTSAVSESALSTLKITSNVSVATQPKSTKASKVLDVPKRDHPPKRTATLKADASQPATKKSATVAKPKAVKETKGSTLSYGDMIADAIEKLAEKKGSSVVAILKYIANNHAVGDFATARRFVHKALKRGVERGTLVTSSEKSSLNGRFRLVKKAEKKPKAAGDGVAKSVKPKKVSSTKKTTAQKTVKKLTAASKKAPTPKKSKPSAKSTTAAKKSTAPKPATAAKKKTAIAKTTKKAATPKKATSKPVVNPAKKLTAVKSAAKKAIAAK